MSITNWIALHAANVSNNTTKAGIANFSERATITSPSQFQITTLVCFSCSCKHRICFKLVWTRRYPLCNFWSSAQHVCKIIMLEILQIVACNFWDFFESVGITHPLVAYSFCSKSTKQSLQKDLEDYLGDQPPPQDPRKSSNGDILHGSNWKRDSRLDQSQCNSRGHRLYLLRVNYIDYRVYSVIFLLTRATFVGKASEHAHYKKVTLFGILNFQRQDQKFFIPELSDLIPISQNKHHLGSLAKKTSPLAWLNTRELL